MPSLPKKILIIDDEKLARDRITRLLSKQDADFVTEESKNGLDALKKIPRFSPDLLFLDIQMPGLTGLELLQQLEKRPFKIIFQTAYDEFAIQAFEQNACDYLLKPFTEERFRVALSRALSALDHESKIKALEQTLTGQGQYLSKITVRQGGTLKIIPATDILCFISRDHCTTLHTATTEHIVDLSITHLAERLDPSLFARTHRNSIVRKNAISQIKSGDNMRLSLSNGISVAVSRSHREAVSHWVSANQ